MSFAGTGKKRCHNDHNGNGKAFAARVLITAALILSMLPENAIYAAEITEESDTAGSYGGEKKTGFTIGGFPLNGLIF